MSEKEDKGFKFDRTDRATRLFLDGLDDLARKVSGLAAQLVHFQELIKTELAHYVSHRQLWAYLAVMCGLGYFLHARIQALVDAMVLRDMAAMEERRKKDAADDEELKWLRRKIDGSEHLEEPPKKRR